MNEGILENNNRNWRRRYWMERDDPISINNKLLLNCFILDCRTVWNEIIEEMKERKKERGRNGGGRRQGKTKNWIYTIHWFLLPHIYLFCYQFKKETSYGDPHYYFPYIIFLVSHRFIVHTKVSFGMELSIASLNLLIIMVIIIIIIRYNNMRTTTKREECALTKCGCLSQHWL